MATILSEDQIKRQDKIDRYRISEEPPGDPWKMAWECVGLAKEIERSQLREPTAEAIGVLWLILETAEYCDRLLAERGETSADDNGDNATYHVRSSLGRLAGRSIRLAQRDVPA
jgi:hypothetical protein